MNVHCDNSLNSAGEALEAFFRKVENADGSCLQMYRTLKNFLQVTPLFYRKDEEGELRATLRLLLEEVGVSQTDVYADKVRHFSREEMQRLHIICLRLAEGHPVQYAIGYAWFMERRFEVNESVLIPRPETAELVSWAVSEAEQMVDLGKGLNLLDAGTGSGCIAVSLKLTLLEARITACDLSPEALAMARRNAERLGAEVDFSLCDMLCSFPSPPIAYDLVVSNPPYIRLSEREEMEENVTRFEPSTALFVPDADPLMFYRALARHCVGGRLRRGGKLLVEINRAFGADTVRLFQNEGLVNVSLRCDAFGAERMVSGEMP